MIHPQRPITRSQIRHFGCNADAWMGIGRDVRRLQADASQNLLRVMVASILLLEIAELKILWAPVQAVGWESLDAGWT